MSQPTVSEKFKQRQIDKAAGIVVKNAPLESYYRRDGAT